MSSKLILIILSYSVSKLVCFFETQCSSLAASPNVSLQSMIAIISIYVKEFRRWTQVCTTGGHLFGHCCKNHAVVWFLGQFTAARNTDYHVPWQEQISAARPDRHSVVLIARCSTSSSQDKSAAIWLTGRLMKMFYQLLLQIGHQCKTVLGANSSQQLQHHELQVNRQQTESSWDQ